MSINQKSTVRAPVNPLDVSTIVSIFPKRIEESKPTIQPGIFVIEAGTYEKPATLTVGPSSWWREIDEDQPLLEIPVSSILVADSIVKDYCNGLLGCDMDGAIPGLFYVQGEVDSAEVIKKHKNLLDRAQTKQKNWYLNLVKLADALWARSSGNPLSIAEDMKLAANALNLKEKPWLKDFTTISEMAPCASCGTLRNTSFPMCPNCKAVLDKDKFTALGLKFAG